MLRKSFIQMIEELGFQASGCHDAQSAILELDSSYSAVLLNPLLSSNSGIELLTEKQSYPDIKDIPAIMMVDKPHLYIDHMSSLKSLGVCLILDRADIDSLSLSNAIEHISFSKL